MTTNWREIAKFACGFETCHALINAYLGLSGTLIPFLGWEITPTFTLVAAGVHAALAGWLGTVGWRTPIPSR